MDGILGFLNNEAIITMLGVVWGLFVKYNPKGQSIPNLLIPYGTAIVAFLVKVFGPADAQAAPIEAMFMAKLPIGGFLGNLLGAGISAGWLAIQNSLIYEVFLRHPLAAAGVKKV